MLSHDQASLSPPTGPAAGFILLAAALSYILPAGEFERREDPATGRSVVVPGTFHRVTPSPVGLFDALVAIPKGLVDAADVIFLVFLVGGAFAVVDQTGTLRRGVDRLVRRLQGRAAAVIPISCLVFALGGILINMGEEFIALIPALLILTSRMGFNPLTAVAMTLGAATVGASFSPINPFQVGIAQKLAQLPLLSGSAFRMVFLSLALTLWIAWTMHYAVRTRSSPAEQSAAEAASEGSGRDAAILGVVLATFAIFVLGVMRWEWGFNEMSALFFAMGVLSGLLGGLGVDGTTAAYIDGFRTMAYAALLIGFARAIFVVLEAGHIVDTIVHGLVTPIAGLPIALSALGMMGAHMIIHLPVPSLSGQAVLTLPVLVPLSDLIGLSRQVTVLAYQYGAGLAELLNPTNGALMAVLAAARVRYEEWLHFVLPIFAVLAGLGVVAILVGIATGLR